MRRSLAAVPLALVCALTVPGALAQTGGSTSGGVGGSTGTGGSLGTGGIGNDTTGRSISGPTPRTPTTGPQSRSPAMIPSPIPPRDTGTKQVPSAGNAERNSPIYRQDTPAGSAMPQRHAVSPSRDATNPQLDGINDPVDPSDTSRAPQMDTPIGGSGVPSGGGGSATSGTAGTGDPLVPTDPSGRPAEAGPGRSANTISDEPNRVTRGGGAAGKNLDECMKIWDPSTHMTKDQWKTTCERLGR